MTGPNHEAEYEAFHKNMMDLQHYESVIKEMLIEMKKEIEGSDIYPGDKPIVRFWMMFLMKRLPKDQYWEEWLKKNI